jgi:hypothetical protein
MDHSTVPEGPPQDGVAHDNGAPEQPPAQGALQTTSTCPTADVSGVEPDIVCDETCVTPVPPAIAEGWSAAPPPAVQSPAQGEQGGDGGGADALPLPSHPFLSMAGASAQAHLAGIQPGWARAELEKWFDNYLTVINALDEAKVLSLGEWEERCTALAEALTKADYPPETTNKYRARAKKVARAREKEKAAQEKEKAAQVKEKLKAQALEDEAAGQAPCRFSLLERRLPDPWAGPVGRLPGAPPASKYVTSGIYDHNAERFITNFSVAVVEDLEILDDGEGSRRFVLDLEIFGDTKRLEIKAEDFARDDRLRGALYAAAGAAADFEGGAMGTVRSAVSQLGRRDRVIPRRWRTRDFGWTPDGDAFLTPGGRVTAGGFIPVGPDADLDVDLGAEEYARHLRLRPLEASELTRVKRHIVEDLLRLQDRKVTYSLLGSAAAALFHPFRGDGGGRYALWLQGLTGAGKSFVAQLFLNLFGDFRVGAGRVASWSGTANFLQRQGYYFKDSLYLIDDFKPGAVRQQDALRVLQNYADGTGRGRLKEDSSTMITRPIRGLLVATGEDVVEHAASSAARSIVVPVSQGPKDVPRGMRCLTEMANYPGVTADFVRWLLAEERTAGIPAGVKAWRDFYYGGVQDRQNGLRIAANFAVLAAGFCEFAHFLADVWPNWQDEVLRFTTEDLVELRDDMLEEVQEQQDSVVFLSVLADLFAHKAVTVFEPVDRARRIGKRLPIPGDVWCISTTLALEAVQDSLRRQVRPPLRATDRALLAQLRQDGKLLDPSGKPLPPGGGQAPTKAFRFGGEYARCFIMARETLMGPSAPPAPAGPSEAAS